MKRAVSVSLGTSRRNFTVRLELFGQEIEVRRIGCDGDLRRLKAHLRELDGRVDAIGLGGMNFAYRVGNRCFPVPQAQAVRCLVRETPLVDGSLLKDTLERWVVVYLEEERGFRWAGTPVLVASVLDRFGLAEEMYRRGARVLAGDLFFALHLPGPFLSLPRFSGLARLLLPGIRWVPLTWIYPLGAAQNSAGRIGRGLPPVAVLAGDLHLVLHRLPADLRGRVVLVNSLWPEEERLLRERGAAGIVTTMPAVGGYSWASNVWEAVLTALWGEELRQLTVPSLAARLVAAGLVPKVEGLHEVHR
ncbi:MAG: quinate 5-dehydrogenase [Moorellales bacterium]